MNIKTGFAAAVAVLAASQGAAQDLVVGMRVRITTNLGFHCQGRLAALDSLAFSVFPDDSLPTARILRSDVKTLEKSAGMEEEVRFPGWVEAANLVGAAGGAWYGATGWGHNGHPRGVVGGALGFVAFGVLSGEVLEGFGREVSEEKWKKVDLTPTVQPVITSGAGGRLLVGVSFSLR